MKRRTNVWQNTLTLEPTQKQRPIILSPIRHPEALVTQSQRTSSKMDGVDEVITRSIGKDTRGTQHNIYIYIYIHRLYIHIYSIGYKSVRSVASGIQKVLSASP